MEIRNLITFVQVAELGSFTKAAEHLGYSQSTVSFQIKQLEEELHCMLFERINRTVTLTQSGRDLLRYAQKIRYMTEEFKQSMDDSREVSGFVHVVTPDSVCEDMLTTNYIDFHRRYPDIRLKFTTADTGDMFRMLNHNEADVMLTLDNHVFLNDYVIAKEEHVPMHFVTSPRSPLAGKKRLSLKDLVSQPFLLTEKGMGYRRVLDKMLAKASLEITPVLEVGRTDLITTLLEESCDISFLPDFVTKEKVEAGKLTYLDVRDAEPDIWKQLIYRKDKWLSRSLEAFLAYVKEAEFGDRKISL